MYLVLGIQRYGNTESLFQQAARLGCEYIFEDELDEKVWAEAPGLSVAFVNEEILKFATR